MSLHEHIYNKGKKNQISGQESGLKSGLTHHRLLAMTKFKDKTSDFLVVALKLEETTCFAWNTSLKRYII